MRWFLGRLLAHFDVEESVLLALGADDHGGERFNMTTLALRGSRFHNGVSKIHGDVASHMEGYLWPQVTPAENPIQHVTRSEGRRVGKECVSTGRSRWSQDH